MDEELRAIERMVEQRRPRIRPPQKMADVLSSLLAKRGYARVLATSNLEEVWQAAAGQKLGGDTRAGNLKRGVLEITVRNSAVLQELTFVKKKLLEKIIASGQTEIKNLKFKVGALD